MDGDAPLMQPTEAGVPAYSHIWTGDAPSPSPPNPLRPPHTGPDPLRQQPTLQPPRPRPAAAVQSAGHPKDNKSAALFKFMGLNAIQLGAIGLMCILLVAVVALM